MRIAALLAALSLVACASRVWIGELPRRSLEECGVEAADQTRGLDVVVMIDVSTSTSLPSGADIDGDGKIGEFRHGSNTDPGDSLLAAQVGSIRSLFSEIRTRDLRIGIITYAGRTRFSDPLTVGFEREAFVRSPLSETDWILDEVLHDILLGGSNGTSNFAAGMQRALDTLEDGLLPGEARGRLVLFLSDSPTPIRPGPTVHYYRVPGNNPNPNGVTIRNDPYIALAAKRAIRHDVAFHTFGLGEAADAEQPHILSRVAGATGGRFWAVEDPTRLHCNLVSALTEAGEGAAARQATDRAVDESLGARPVSP